MSGMSFSGSVPTPNVISNPWVTLPDNWYNGAWFTAKGNMSTAPAWMLFDGDSITEGVNPGNTGYIATGWPDQLRTLFRSKYPAIPLYGDFYTIWGYSFNVGGQNPVNEGFGTPVNGSSQFEAGFGSALAIGTPAVDFQSITTGNIPGWTGGLVTGFDIVYYDFGACTWAFTIDGGEGSPIPTVTGATWSGSQWVVTCTGGSYTGGNVKKVTVRGLTAGSHVIDYGYITVAGNAIWIGLSVFTGSTGGAGFVRSAYSGRRAVDAATSAGANFGYSGTFGAMPNDRCALWSGSGPTQGAAQITPVPFGFPTQPSLAFLAWGVNDAACYIHPASSVDALQRKIIAYRRGVPNCNICLVQMSYPDPNNSDNNLPGNGNRYVRWKREFQNLAQSYNCAYVDIDAKWGGHPVANGLQVSGNVHPTAAGHLDIANTILALI